MNLRLTSSAIALVAMGAPALADVTPEQVWQSWIDYYESAGYEVTESGREKAGDTLTVNDVSASVGMPESQLEIRFGTVTLTETGDGKVRTVFSDRATGSANGTDADGQSYAIPFVIDMPGNAVVSSGAPEEMTHEFDYPTIDIALSTVKSGDQENPLPIKLSIVGTTGEMRFVPGAATRYDYRMGSERLTAAGDITSQEGENVKFDANLGALEVVGQMSVPEGADLNTDMNAAVKAGLAMNGTMKSGALTATFGFAGNDMDGQPQTGNGSYNGQGFELTFAMSQDGLVYQGGSDAFNAEFSGGQLPLPVKYAADSASFDLQFPVMKSDEPQPFKLAYSLAGLSIGDELWAMIDPEAKLPRDPASLDVDLTGLAQVNSDLLDPDALVPPMDDMGDTAMSGSGMKGADTDASDMDSADMEGGADMDGADMNGSAMAPMPPEPFLPVELNINQLALSLLGANISASGQFTGPEGGNLTQSPVGKLQASFEGVNGLLDTLGSMGLIPEDQLMGTRMMLMMFAKPVSEGEDKLSTELEFKEDGSLFANGQQLR